MERDFCCWHPYQGCGNPWRHRNRRAKVCSLLTEHRELIDEVLVRDTPVKALIDTGVSVSLLNAKFFQRAKMNRRLKRSDLEISQPDSGNISISGRISLPVVVGGKGSEQRFYMGPWTG